MITGIMNPIMNWCNMLLKVSSMRCLFITLITRINYFFVNWCKMLLKSLFIHYLFVTFITEIIWCAHINRNIRVLRAAPSGPFVMLNLEQLPVNLGRDKDDSKRSRIQGPVLWKRCKYLSNLAYLMAILFICATPKRQKAYLEMSWPGSPRIPIMYEQNSIITLQFWSKASLHLFS